MVKSIHKFVNELAVSYVNSVLDGVFLTAEDAVGFAAGFQNIWFHVLFNNKLDLLQ